eukprot:CAMPEP_0115480412 /NCGR_PEP_ID=MMETSP0271-20121206/57257_1 /TAXON_ID=71861 /ORGANISM="Scrippsiella trochoidea, Strain CCMP3099" /LENGTH=75 /DNA_ID=CAMNT_0002908091 /DNA_START=65 /DNA_END=292 /DNA_ORIENTATION=+
MLNLGDIASKPPTGKRDEPVAKCNNLARSSSGICSTICQNHPINWAWPSELTSVFARQSLGSRSGNPEMSNANSR